MVRDLDQRNELHVPAAARDRRLTADVGVMAGPFTVAVGGGQPGRAGSYASAAEGVIGRLEVTGEPFEIP